MNAYKLMVREEGRAEGEVSGLHRWAQELPHSVRGVSRVELDLLDPAAQQSHEAAFPSPVPNPGFSAMVSLWADEAPTASPPGYSLIPIEVTDRVGYGFDDDALGEVRGYKKVTMWKARPLPRAQWDELYKRHIITVPALQPIWRYRQNLIERKPPDFPYDAMSENWWLTLHDLTSGFFHSEETRRAVFEETLQFIDMSVTTSLILRNHVLFRL